MSDMEYAGRARSYYGDLLPNRCRQVPDPERLFRELGMRVEDQVQTTERALAGPDRPVEGFWRRWPVEHGARLRASEWVTAAQGSI